MRIFTVGHSTHTLDAFVSMLTAHGIETLVDVRSIPRSRRNPQFNQDTLPDALAAHGIAYEHIAGLGGRRSRTPGIDPERNGAWDHPAFRNYADYALTLPFRDALEHLVALASSSRTAIMCAEAVWWRCHRRIITDHLLARGIDVAHIVDVNKTDAATMTPFARVRVGDTVEYPSLLGAKSDTDESRTRVPGAKRRTHKA